VGATLDETRVELEAQRARVRGTATDLESTTRQALDIRERIRRHPMQVAGVVAGAAFLLLGGPHRTVRLLRRTLRGATNGDAAYASLPPVLQRLVDETAPGFGASKAEARRELALALHAWREDPKNRKKADKAVSEALLPPGPERAFWTMVEVAGVATAGLIARMILTRGLRSAVFGLGRPAQPTPASPASPGPAASVTGPAGSSRQDAAVLRAPRTGGPAAETTGYTGWSGRQASVAGPAREPSSSATKPDC
jgi:hypothetical protein